MTVTKAYWIADQAAYYVTHRADGGFGNRAAIVLAAVFLPSDYL